MPNKKKKVKDNFAKKGKKSIHNMLYWTSAPYVGIGTAAHSYYFKENYVIRAINEGKLRKYLSFPVNELKTEEILSENDYIFDKFYSEMRKLYIDIEDFLLQTGVDLFNIIKELNLGNSRGGTGTYPYELLLGGFIEIKNNQLWLTDLGIINSDTVFEIFYELLLSKK